jgi:hypothetical protein
MAVACGKQEWLQRDMGPVTRWEDMPPPGQQMDRQEAVLICLRRWRVLLETLEVVPHRLISWWRVRWFLVVASSRPPSGENVGL